ncbi:MAG: V-type ATP synthase subunit A [Candidatus Omnitrophica bacterium]|nr:V-type ATP synthase subunit A [Candidatus Omnitrophota bacterium]
MSSHRGEIVAINGNMITVKFNGDIIQNEVGYVLSRGRRLKSEVIKINGDRAFMQVFEYTKGISVGDEVEFSGEMLSVQLGPGLLTQIYDGLQNSLPRMAEDHGFFLPVGVELDALTGDDKWEFTPIADKGDTVTAGDYLGWVPEGIFEHKIMVPFYLREEYTVQEIKEKGTYGINETVARIKSASGEQVDVTMNFNWPVKIPISAYREKVQPEEPLITKIRIIDTLFPVAKGGTYCIPGPFGAGKTVLQQLTSRYAEVDIVIIAACGERAGEVVETLKEFPELVDPRTGKSLMERTIIICNTSSMPVAARESSVYTATTLAEYYRQMGLDVLMLADSTSRWAQAMREISGRLEEIPGEEAYPAYLESRIASFYERAGLVELADGGRGSLTIGGTVSPAGGNFEEPVTQGTLKVVGAFHGLSRERSDARKYPSIDPLESWSKYKSIIEEEKIARAKETLRKGQDVSQMMKVVGEEGTSIEDFIVYLKGEFIDAVYLQQDGFDKVDAATKAERQKYVFAKVVEVLDKDFSFREKSDARDFFYALRHKFIDWNYKEWESEGFKEQEQGIDSLLKGENNEESVHQNSEHSG